MPPLRPLLLALLCGAAGCAAAPVRDPPPAAAAGQLVDPAQFAGIPNLAFDFYEVTGADPEAIRRSIDARRPYDPNSRKRVDALTTWRIDWAVPSGNGSCDISRAEVGFSARVALPSLAPGVALPPESLARWQAFRAWLERHEAWHARHAWSHVGDVLAAIRAAGCRNAGEAAAAAVRRIGEEQHLYDLETRHGANGGVSFP